MQSNKGIISQIVFACFCVLALTAIVIQSVFADEIPSVVRLVGEVKTFMAEHYYDRSKLPAIIADLEAIEKNPDSVWPDELKRIFDDLQVSHIGLHTPDEFKYYELLDVFRFIHADKLKAMYPPDGIVRYPGIGILSNLINERYFVAFVFADTPAAQADILPGDELLTVDDQEYSPIKVFRGKVGRTVKLTLRREQNGPLLERKITVKALNPTDTFVNSTTASSRVIEHKGLKFGYIRLYCFTNDKIPQILVEKLSSADFASVDALILDLRGRLGGAPLDTAEIFVGGTPKVESISPTGEIRTDNFRWTKPLVAIIGPETRSGMEIIAYSLKKAGVPLVGAPTKGAVMGGTTFILSDGSLLEVPCMDVKVEGLRLEGVGVEPTVQVDATLEYSQGRDVQVEAAVSMMGEIVEGRR